MLIYYYYHFEMIVFTQSYYSVIVQYLSVSQLTKLLKYKVRNIIVVVHIWIICPRPSSIYIANITEYWIKNGVLGFQWLSSLFSMNIRRNRQIGNFVLLKRCLLNVIYNGVYR